MVKAPEDYKWSSYGHYLGKPSNQVPVNTEIIISGGLDSSEKSIKYKRFVEEGLRNLNVPGIRYFREGCSLKLEEERLFVEEFQPFLIEYFQRLFGSIPDQKLFFGAMASILMSSGIASGIVLAATLGISRNTLHRYKRNVEESRNYQKSYPTLGMPFSPTNKTIILRGFLCQRESTKRRMISRPGALDFSGWNWTPQTFSRWTAAAKGAP